MLHTQRDCAPVVQGKTVAFVSVFTETLDVVALRREVQKQCGFVCFVRVQIRGVEIHTVFLEKQLTKCS